MIPRDAGQGQATSPRGEGGRQELDSQIAIAATAGLACAPYTHCINFRSVSGLRGLASSLPSYFPYLPRPPLRCPPFPSTSP